MRIALGVIGLVVDDAFKALIGSDCNSVLDRILAAFQFSARQHHVFGIHEFRFLIVLKNLGVEVETGAAGDKYILKIQQVVVFCVEVFNQFRTDFRHFSVTDFVDISRYGFSVFHIADRPAVFA